MKTKIIIEKDGWIHKQQWQDGKVYSEQGLGDINVDVEIVDLRNTPELKTKAKKKVVNELTSEQFAYWLQGKFEGRNLSEITELERKCIQFHLDEITGLKTT